MDFFIHALVGLTVVVIWEALGLREWSLKLLRRAQRWRTWKRFFDIDGDITISTSQVEMPDDKLAARVPDVLVEQRLRQKLGASAVIIENEPFRIDNASSHSIVIGSSRYSPEARYLQQQYGLPYEYVFDHLQGDPPFRALKLVSAHGQEYVSSIDTKAHRGDTGTDYGCLFLAALTRGKRLYWVSGIHGAGTLGVAKYLLAHPDQFLDSQPDAETWAQQWLFRTEYDIHAKESWDMVKHVELIRGPEQCTRRSPAKMRAIISDFGNVLMTFDRDRTYRALAHVCGKPYREIAATIEESKVRQEYEIGTFDDAELFARICALFPGVKLDFDAFAEWWGDIFWENRSVVEMFRGLQNTTRLVLLSNTNHLHYSSVCEHYADVVNLFHGRVLSFEERKAKPAPELFLRAMALAGNGVRPNECVYIDDMPEYVEVARGLGMNAFLYHGYPALVRDLRTVGFDIL